MTVKNSTKSGMTDSPTKQSKRFPPLLTFDLKRQRTTVVGTLGVLVIAAYMGTTGNLDAALVGLLSTAITAMGAAAMVTPKETDTDEEQDALIAGLLDRMDKLDGRDDV